MDELISGVVLGAGATAVMDLWGLARRPLLGWPVPDYALVGRWVGHMSRGRFRHAAIATSTPVAAERALGWTVHYLTGMAFAGLLLALAGPDWLHNPTWSAPLAVGIGSVAAPLLLMQPAMGAGIAARRTANPTRARVQSLISHTVFGIGLYATAQALNLITT
jgi:Protein of unknown function (DUF2938)